MGMCECPCGLEAAPPHPLQTESCQDSRAPSTRSPVSCRPVGQPNLCVAQEHAADLQGSAFLPGEQFEHAGEAWLQRDEAAFAAADLKARSSLDVGELKVGSASIGLSLSFAKSPAPHNAPAMESPGTYFQARSGKLSFGERNEGVVFSSPGGVEKAARSRYDEEPISMPRMGLPETDANDPFIAAGLQPGSTTGVPLPETDAHDPFIAAGREPKAGADAGSTELSQEQRGRPNVTFAGATNDEGKSRARPATTRLEAGQAHAHAQDMGVSRLTSNTMLSEFGLNDLSNAIFFSHEPAAHVTGATPYYKRSGLNAIQSAEERARADQEAPLGKLANDAAAGLDHVQRASAHESLFAAMIPDTTQLADSRASSDSHTASGAAHNQDVLSYSRIMGLQSSSISTPPGLQDGGSDAAIALGAGTDALSFSHLMGLHSSTHEGSMMPGLQEQSTADARDAAAAEHPVMPGNPAERSHEALSFSQLMGLRSSMRTSSTMPGLEDQGDHRDIAQHGRGGTEETLAVSKILSPVLSMPASPEPHEDVLSVSNSSLVLNETLNKLMATRERVNRLLQDVPEPAESDANMAPMFSLSEGNDVSDDNIKPAEVAEHIATYASAIQSGFEDLASNTSVADAPGPNDPAETPGPISRANASVPATTPGSLASAGAEAAAQKSPRPVEVGDNTDEEGGVSAAAATQLTATAGLLAQAGDIDIDTPAQSSSTRAATDGNSDPMNGTSSADITVELASDSRLYAETLAQEHATEAARRQAEVEVASANEAHRLLEEHVASANEVRSLRNAPSLFREYDQTAAKSPDGVQMLQQDMPSPPSATREEIERAREALAFIQQSSVPSLRHARAPAASAQLSFAARPDSPAAAEMSRPTMPVPTDSEAVVQARQPTTVVEARQGGPFTAAPQPTAATTSAPAANPNLDGHAKARNDSLFYAASAVDLTFRSLPPTPNITSTPGRARSRKDSLFEGPHTVRSSKTFRHVRTKPTHITPQANVNGFESEESLASTTTSASNQEPLSAPFNLSEWENALSEDSFIGIAHAKNQGANRGFSSRHKKWSDDDSSQRSAPMTPLSNQVPRLVAPNTQYKNLPMPLGPSVLEAHNTQYLDLPAPLVPESISSIGVTSPSTAASGATSAESAPPASSSRASSAAPAFSDLIRVPRTLETKFCRIGKTTVVPLRLENVTANWVECSLDVTAERQVFQFNNPHTMLLRPRASETLGIVFAPARTGMHRAFVQITAVAVELTDTEPRPLGARSVTAVAIKGRADSDAVPTLEVHPSDLEFGLIKSNALHALPVDLINRGSEILHVAAKVDNADVEHFYVASEQPLSKTDTVANRSVHLNCTVPPSHDTASRLWILFSPTSTTRQTNFHAALSLTYHVDPTALATTTSMCTIPVTAVLEKRSANVPKLQVPQNMQNMRFSTEVGAALSQFIPVKNAGDTPAPITLSVSDDTHCFSLPSATCVLSPGGVHEVEVTFSPKQGVPYVEAQLVLSVGKQGQAYQVALIGMAVPSAAPAMLASPPQKVKKSAKPQPRKLVAENSSSDEMARAVAAGPNLPAEPLSILCNRAVIAWAGVAVKDTCSQVVQLRNNSKGAALDIVVSINKENANGFRIGTNTDGECVDEYTVVKKGVKHGETVSIELLFTPRQMAMYTSGLVVMAKVSSARKKMAGDVRGKYTVPMIGYGGKSNVEIESVRLAGDKGVSGDQLALHLGRLQPGKMCHLIVTLKNTGDRAAFVSTEFTDAADVVLPSTKGKVSPACLVILGKRSRALRLTFRISDQDLDGLVPGHPSGIRRSPAASNVQNALAMIKVYSGDEIVRAVFKQSQGVYYPTTKNNLAEARTYLRYFDGEELIRWGKKIDVATAGVRHGLGSLSVLQGSTRCSRLAITGAGPELESTQEHASGGSKFATCPVPELSPARSNYSEAATVVLSKSPPGARYRGNTQNARKGQEAPSYTYTLSPQRLKFAAGKGRKHKDLILSNFGDTSIEFDVIVPSYALAVEPAAGKVPPHSHIRIQVRAQKSFAGDGKPWIGSLFVLCNGTDTFRVLLLASASTWLFFLGVHLVSSIYVARVLKMVHTMPLCCLHCNPCLCTKPHMHARARAHINAAGERHPIEVIVGNERGAPPARMASRPANTPHAVQEKAARGVPGPKDDAHACCGLCFASSGLLFRAVSVSLTPWCFAPARFDMLAFMSTAETGCEKAGAASRLTQCLISFTFFLVRKEPALSLLAHD